MHTHLRFAPLAALALAAALGTTPVAASDQAQVRVSATILPRAVCSPVAAAPAPQVQCRSQGPAPAWRTSVAPAAAASDATGGPAAGRRSQGPVVTVEF
jgi:hypothetical protein